MCRVGDFEELEKLNKDYRRVRVEHEIDFANVEILDRANTIKKFELKEMLHIRKHKPSLNKQLFTLIIRNVKLVNFEISADNRLIAFVVSHGQINLFSCKVGTKSNQIKEFVSLFKIKIVLKVKRMY